MTHNDILQVVEKISELYREKRNEECDLLFEINEIEDRLSDKKLINSMTVFEFNQLKDKYLKLKEEADEIGKITDGIALAREEVFKLLEGNV